MSKPLATAPAQAFVVSVSCLALLAGPARAQPAPSSAPSPRGSIAAAPHSPPAGAAGAEAERPRLTGGAGSIDELLDRFVAALASGEGERLEELRVTESEYRSILIPGSVDPGAPPQVLSEEGLEYFWAEMSQKSAAHREAILARFGRRALTPLRHSFEKGEREFAGYKAYEKLVLVFRDEKGAEVELRTGSIVERDGRFKFASFIRD
jgi:hypothetical protein